MMDMTDGTLAVVTLADDGTFLTLLTGTVGWMDWPTAFHTLWNNVPTIIIHLIFCTQH